MHVYTCKRVIINANIHANLRTRLLTCMHTSMGLRTDCYGSSNYICGLHLNLIATCALSLHACMWLWVCLHGGRWDLIQYTNTTAHFSYAGRCEANNVGLCAGQWSLSMSQVEACVKKIILGLKEKLSSKKSRLGYKA